MCQLKFSELPEPWIDSKDEVECAANVTADNDDSDILDSDDSDVIDM